VILREKIVLLLEMLAIALGVTHFSVPLIYYTYLRRQVDRPWHIKFDASYEPILTVVIPTYNEAALIENRLENIKNQSYPKEKMEVVVVDSASTDETVNIVRKWSSRNPDINVKVLEEPVRKGKSYALNMALKSITSGIIILTDADSLWARNALKEAIKYFSDELVGAVTAVKEPKVTNQNRSQAIESTYRSFYNIVRVAESKIHSTPIFHGELAAFKKNVIEEIGGFPTNVGADDSHMATLIALKGYRAIAALEVVTYELVPSSWRGYAKWKRRRAKHLVQHFSLLLRRLTNAPREFRKVLRVESFLHILNPWLLLMAFIVFLVSLTTEGLSLLKMVVVFVVLTTLLIRQARRILLMWILDQCILVYSSIAGIRSRELIWRKIDELRMKTTMHTNFQMNSF